MCGIAGFRHPRFGSEAYPSVIQNMLGMVSHRGPDELGYYVDDVVALGAVRLAVIDAPGGSQPLADAGGRYWIVFNGEIYNYVELRQELIGLGRRFSTRSDTEVVLQAWMQWGVDALERLNGGFALAIYDRVADEIVLARDRWGKRPLYYSNLGPAIVFGSEMKAMLEFPGLEFRFNASDVATAFACWTMVSDQTGFTDIHQLPVGSYLIANVNGTRVADYLPRRPVVPPFTGTLAEAAERTHAELADSVRLRLRGDVPIGTYLSGGLDSAVVTQLVVALSPHPVHTFSVAFEDEQFDESPDQDRLSRYFGTRHTSLRVGNQDIGTAFPAAVWHAETPVFRTAFVPMFLLSRFVRDRGLTVVLTGEGADEVFLGYDIFKETLLRRRWRTMSEPQRHEALTTVYRYLPHFTGGNARGLSGVFAEFSQDVNADFFSHALRFSNAKLSGRLLRGAGDGLDALRANIDRDRPAFDRLDPVIKAQRLEFVTLLAGYLLSTQGDRMAFAHGVENRCPFLDPSVVRWAESLPVEMRLPGMTDEKFVLKKAFEAVLPAEVLRQPKRPYLAPDVAAFAGGARTDYVEDALSETELTRLGILDVAFTQRLTRKVLSSRPHAVSPRESQAFILVLSLVFLHRFFVMRSYAPPTLRMPAKVHDRRSAHQPPVGT